MLTKPYVEQDCVIEHDGRKFESGGAIVTDDYVVAYVGKHLWDQEQRVFQAPRQLNDWHGNQIGECRFTAAWPMRSHWGSHMYQIHATIDGVRYTGRGMGEGMICRLRRCKGAP